LHVNNKWKGPGDGDLIIIENQVNGEKARPHLGYKAATAATASGGGNSSSFLLVRGTLWPLATFCLCVHHLLVVERASDGWLQEI
jgi:hypothetical protein